MQYEADVASAAPVAVADEPLVHQDCRRTAVGDCIDGRFHVVQAGSGSDGDPVVHGNYDAVPGAPVHDPFESDVLSEHDITVLRVITHHG